MKLLRGMAIGSFFFACFATGCTDEEFDELNDREHGNDLGPWTESVVGPFVGTFAHVYKSQSTTGEVGSKWFAERFVLSRNQYYRYECGGLAPPQELTTATPLAVCDEGKWSFPWADLNQIRLRSRGSDGFSNDGVAANVQFTLQDELLVNLQPQARHRGLCSEGCERVHVGNTPWE